MPKITTAADLSRNIASTLAAARADLDAACESRSLALDAPAGCPADLLADLEAHNAAAADLEARASDADRATAALPALIAGDATAAEIVRAATELKQARYDLLRRRVALIEGRRPLLERTADVLKAELANAEAALEAERGKARKALVKAGIGPEADLHFEANPGAAEARFAARLNGAVPVRQAITWRDDLIAGQNRVVDLTRGLERDLSAVGRALVTAFQAVAGL